MNSIETSTNNELNNPVPRAKIYTIPSCGQCSVTIRVFKNSGVRYQVIDLESNPEEHQRLIALGSKNAPVVEAGGSRWSGFNPDLIAAYAETVPFARNAWEQGHLTARERILNAGYRYPPTDSWEMMHPSDRDLWEERRLRVIAKNEDSATGLKRNPDTDNTVAAPTPSVQRESSLSQMTQQCLSQPQAVTRNYSV